MPAAPYEVIRADPLDRVDLAFLPGAVTLADLSRLSELLEGTYTTQPWDNYSLPSQP